MNMSRRDFSRVVGFSGLVAATAAANGSSQSTPSQQVPPALDPTPPPRFKPTRVERSKVLKICSGRNRPDLTPGLLARLYGEAPVNPAAMAGWVRPVASIRRINASGEQVAARFEDTKRFLAARGFDMFDTHDPLVSAGRAGRRRDREPTL